MFLVNFFTWHMLREGTGQNLMLIQLRCKGAVMWMLGIPGVVGQLWGVIAHRCTIWFKGNCYYITIL